MLGQMDIFWGDQSPKLGQRNRQEGDQEKERKKDKHVIDNEREGQEILSIVTGGCLRQY